MCLVPTSVVSGPSKGGAPLTVCCERNIIKWHQDNLQLYIYYSTCNPRLKGFLVSSCLFVAASMMLSLFQESKLVKVDVLLNEKPVSELAFICHAERAKSKSIQIVTKLKENLPRQQFSIKIQVGFAVVTGSVSLVYRGPDPKKYHYPQ